MVIAFVDATENATCQLQQDIHQVVTFNFCSIKRCESKNKFSHSWAAVYYTKLLTVRQYDVAYYSARHQPCAP